MNQRTAQPAPSQGAGTADDQERSVQPMKFCSQCGSPVSWQVPSGDHRPRFVCATCQAVHYQNPRIVAGCLPLWEGRILLCRRAIEPRLGFWTLPGGFMENGETMQQAAARETLEEACAQVEGLELYTLFDLPHIHQVHVFFRARLSEPRFAAGDESLEVRLFAESELPWRELAFPTTGHTLEYFLRDRSRRTFPVRNELLPPLHSARAPTVRNNPAPD